MALTFAESGTDWFRRFKNVATGGRKMSGHITCRLLLLLLIITNDVIADIIVRLLQENDKVLCNRVRPG